MDRVDVRTSLRRAGEVVRYHTWPMLQRETVAHHTWNVLVLWLKIFGRPTPDILELIIYHDVGELYTGDVPFPVKRDHPEIGKALGDLETKSRAAMGINEVMAGPTNKWRLKVCDLIDMMEVGIREAQMGNKFAFPIIHGTREAVYGMCKETNALSEDVLKVLKYVRELEDRHGRYEAPGLY